MVLTAVEIKCEISRSKNIGFKAADAAAHSRDAILVPVAAQQEVVIVQPCQASYVC